MISLLSFVWTAEKSVMKLYRAVVLDWNEIEDNSHKNCIVGGGAGAVFAATGSQVASCELAYRNEVVRTWRWSSAPYRDGEVKRPSYLFWFERRRLLATVTKATCVTRTVVIGWLWTFEVCGAMGVGWSVWCNHLNLLSASSSTKPLRFFYFWQSIFLERLIPMGGIWHQRSSHRRHDFHFRQNVLHGTPTLIKQVIGAPTKGKNFPGALCYNHCLC